MKIVTTIKNVLHKDKRYFLATDISQKEYEFLKRNYSKGEIVYLYKGHTYRCISKNAMAFTKNYNQNPFFEIPKNCVKPLEK